MSFGEKLITFLTVGIWVFMAILACYNLSLHINHTGSGQPATIMKHLGIFRSPDGVANGAFAPEQTVADATQETTQPNSAPEGEDQPEAAEEE